MPDRTPNPELHGLSPADLLGRALESAPPSPGAAGWTPPAPEELAALLPQYRIESLIGRGGMGAVYKGTQVALDRTVAIKLLPAEIAADAEFVARFEREARTLAQLQHPGIVAIYDFGQTSVGHLYFVMEFVDGTDLHQILRAQRLDPGHTLEAICQICEALHYAHRQGVIHRDIKPANILFTRAGRAKLADFGLARPTGESTTGLTHTHMVMGTPDYMAPEQREGQADQRADIYALGVMLYEMLTGQRPHGIFALPSKKAPVDPRLDAVVSKALQQEPADRYQQASEMKTDVDRIRSTPRQGVPKVPRVPTPAAPAPRSSFGLAAAIIVLVLALGGLVVWKMAPSRVASAAPVAQSTPLPAVPTPSPATPPPASIVVAATLPPKSEPTPLPPAATPTPTLPAMEPVLLAHRWSYLDRAPATPDQRYAMEITFRPDGTVSTTASSGERLHWWITGPRTVHLQREQPAIQFDAKSGADLTFDAALNQFEGRTSQQHSLSGARLGPATPEVPAGPSRIASLSEQGPNIAAWITSPLTVAVPDAIWENLNFLKEALKDEAAQKPAASPACYPLAVRYCTTLLAFLEEREQASARAGGAAVLHQRSSLTAQQRDHLTWPQYFLEKDERAERHENARTAERFQSGQRDVVWSTRTTVMRREMQSLYAQLREALRQKPAVR